MNDKTRINLTRNVIEMVDSLRLAVEEAGGMFFGIDYLERTTVLEFIAHLATNHIRFIFVKPEDKE